MLYYDLKMARIICPIWVNLTYFEPKSATHGEDEDTGMSIFGIQSGSDWPQNGTNRGPFQITHLYTFAYRVKMYWSISWKRPRFVPFGSVWPTFGPNLVTLVWKVANETTRPYRWCFGKSPPLKHILEKIKSNNSLGFKEDF